MALVKQRAAVANHITDAIEPGEQQIAATIATIVSKRYGHAFFGDQTNTAIITNSAIKDIVSLDGIFSPFQKVI